MSTKLKEDEKWITGLSDCCNAPLKEVGHVLTILLCSECGQMCNKKYGEDDDFPYDFFDEDD